MHRHCFGAFYNCISPFSGLQKPLVKRTIVSFLLAPPRQRVLHTSFFYSPRQPFRNIMDLDKRKKNGPTRLPFVINKASQLSEQLTKEAPSNGQDREGSRNRAPENPTGLLLVMWLVCFTGVKHIC